MTRNRAFRRTRRACPLALGLGRLDHHRLSHRQREVDRRGVEAVVQQPLGDVHRRDALARPFSCDGRGDELVHAAVALRHRENVLHTAEQVVGVEHRVFGSRVGAHRGRMRADVAIGPHQHADVLPKKLPHAADRLRPVVTERIVVAIFRDDRAVGKYGETFRSRRSDPRPGPPPPCGPLKVLCGL